MAEFIQRTKTVRHRYSDDFLATALAGVAANGGNINRTARALGIPAKTLEQSANRTPHSPIA